LPEIVRITGIPRSSVRDSLLRAGVTLRSANESLSQSQRKASGQVRWNSPYGFKYERGCLIPHPQEFETLRILLQRSGDGDSFEDVSSLLNGQKLRPRSAPAWTRFIVRQIVKWHQDNPEVLSKLEKETTGCRPSKCSQGKPGKTVNKPKTKRRHPHGTR
jgi:hypothetical protein